MTSAQIGSTDLPQIWNVLDDFEERESNLRDFHLSRLLVEPFVDPNANYAGIAACATTIQGFTLLNSIAVAKAFGDTKTVIELHKTVEDWVAKGWTEDLENLANALKGPTNAAQICAEL